MKFSYSTSEQLNGGVTLKNLIKQIFSRGYDELVIALPRHCKVFRVGKKDMEIYYSPLIARRNNRSPHSNELCALIMNLIKYRYEKK